MTGRAGGRGAIDGVGRGRDGAGNGMGQSDEGTEAACNKVVKQGSSPSSTLGRIGPRYNCRSGAIYITTNHIFTER